MVKIIVFGIGGLVGFKLANLIMKEKHEFFGTYNLRNPKINSSVKLDVRETDSCRKIIENEKPNIVINSCSLTNVDYCEKHENDAIKLNVEFVRELFSTCKRTGAKLVHLSTDSVFDGTKDTPYNEEDKTNPINIYGRTKYESEKIVLENQNNLVVRASVLYGWLPKFLADSPTSSMKSTNFGQWLIQQLIHGNSVRIITDEVSSPIIADDFAKAILHLSIGNYAGIYHLAPELIINRYEFSCKIAEKLGLDKNLISPITNKELGRNIETGFNKCLSSEKTKSQTKFKFMSLDESLGLIKSQINS